MDAHTESELDAFCLLQTGIEVSHAIEDTQASPYCSLGVIFMGMGIPKVHQQSIAQELSGVSFIALDDFSTSSLIGTDDFSILFGVELGGEFRGIDQVDEHDGELTAFSVRR